MIKDTVALVIAAMVIAIAILVSRANATIDYFTPSRADPWMDIQLWARANTKPSSLFITPPELSGFRIFSERNQLGDNKDGALCSFYHFYAILWKERMAKLESFHNFSRDEIMQLANKYGAGYIVVENIQAEQWDLEAAYANEDYIIYLAP
ncbi:DUF6798 domain-containing protein [Chloroflexota bacterium]